MALLEDWFLARTPDHAGKPVTLVRIDGIVNLRLAARQLPAPLHTHAKRELFRGHRLRALVLTIALGMVAGVGVLPGLMLAKRTGAGLVGMFFFAFTSAAVLIFPLLYGIYLPIARRFHAPTIVKTITAHGYCPSCAYDLRATHSASDLTTCPECGASWRLPKEFAVVKPILVAE